MKGNYLKLAVVIIVFAISVMSCGNKQENKQQVQEIPVIKVLQHDVPVFSEYVGNMYGKNRKQKVTHPLIWR